MSQYYRHYVDLVDKADGERSFLTMERRLLKIIEELGELSEAYLGVTSVNNTKGKTWSDVREEAIDVLIMVLDCALTEITGPFGPVLSGVDCDFIAGLMEGGRARANYGDGSIMDDIFGISGAVRAAYNALEIGLGSAAIMTMASVVSLAAKTAFSEYTEKTSSSSEIDAEFHNIFEKKIKKWMSGASTSMIPKDI